MIYRLGRKPDPWSVPDWASAGPDGTFGNRFDDPEGLYRVLYASSQRLGCFLETLGRFRVDPKLLAELAEIEGKDDYCPLGEVPLEWVEKRMMGAATASGDYADICSSEWISRLRNVLGGHLDRFGLDDLDASVLQMTAPRGLTQLVSRVVAVSGASRSSDNSITILPTARVLGCRAPSVAFKICTACCRYTRAKLDLPNPT